MGRLIKEATYSYRMEQKERREEEAKATKAEKLRKEQEAEEARQKQQEEFQKRQKEEGCFNCKEGHDLRTCTKACGQGRRGNQEAWAVFRCHICNREYKFQSNMLS